jgi:Transcriptional regulator/sugar kinase
MNKVAALGIDVGGTKTLCLLVDSHCESLEEIKFKTAPDEGRGEFTKNLLQAVTELRTKSDERGLRIIGVGVGCAGTVDNQKGRIVVAPNLMCLEDYPISKHLRRVIKTKVTLGNDVQMGLHAEHQLGAAKGCSHVLGVFFGTGVGGAAILDGEIYTGASGLAGQVGNILAQPVGGREAALSHGIVDRIASKAAIAGEALVMATKEWAPYLHKKVGTDLAKIGWGTLKRAIKAGDTRIDEMLRARMRVVGLALSSVVNFLNPQIVVLGGGLMDELPKLVLSELEAGLREHLMPEISKEVVVRPAKLHGAAVALGAAHRALETSRNRERDR